MTVALSALLVLVGLSAPSGPEAQIERLGSLHAAEREAAAAALEQMGPEAVPALRKARQSLDLELRTRAAALLDAIEGRLLTLPTLVTLDFHDRPIAEVVAAIAERGRVTLRLEPERDERWRSQRISLEATAPLTFWEALDQLCRAGRLRLLTQLEEPGLRGLNRLGIAIVGGGPPRTRSESDLTLVPDDAQRAAPTVAAGAVQVALLGLHHQRDRTFISNARPRGGASDSVRLTAQLQVRVEPRLTLAWVGAPQEFEMIDDRGQSLLPDSPSMPPRPVPVNNQGIGLRTGLLEIAIKYPERPGKTIERLRGTIPVVIACRQPDLLVVPLEGTSEKVFRAGETTLVIHDVKALPDRRGTAVELTLTIPEVVSPFTPPVWPGGMNSSLRRPPLPQPQLDFVDARGRVCLSFPLIQNRPDHGLPRTVMVSPPEGTGPPVEVRYSAFRWATVAVPFAFAFENLPMP